MKLSEIANGINLLASSVAELKESSSLTEEETKRKLIEPFFQCFGWDFAEYGSINVEMETKSNRGKDKSKADYCFKIQTESVFIIEAKKLGSKLTEKDKEQLENYMKLDDCRYGALTNGEDYEFYVRRDKDCELFHKICLSNGKSLQESDLQRIMWLDREIWDMWLVLDVKTFEEIIDKFCDVKIESETEQIENETPEQEMKYDYSQRPPNGESITEKEYYEPILEVLREKNGIDVKEIISEIEKKFNTRFTKWDRAKLKSRDIRWENRVRFALEHLKKEGKIKLEDHIYYLIERK